MARLSALDLAAIDALSPHVEWIAGCSTRQRAMPFVAETWRRWLLSPLEDQGAHLPRELVDELLGRYPTNVINRSELRDLALEGQDPDSNLRLLLATLFWGRGKSNGRMMPSFVRTLTSERRDAVLKTTSALVVDGKLAEAYKKWTLPGLRAPFFTKWLWSASLRCTPEFRPLILDSRVWKSLDGPLRWDSIQAAGTRHRDKRYAAYVEAVHRWAPVLSSTSLLSVSPEDVECAPFTANGDLSQLTNRGSH